MIRVGFVIDFSSNWLGGISYYRNLLNAVSLLEDRELETVVLTGAKTDAAQLKGFPDVEIIKTALLDGSGAPRLLRDAGLYFLSRDRLLEKLLAKNNIKVLSHSRTAAGPGTITIGWIPDFQHRHMPEFFSKSEVEARDRYFGNICRHSARVIVSSEDAKKDLAQFFPQWAGKARVLRFVACPASGAAATMEELEARYGFKGPYIYCPNQFWAHKNHRVIIEALNILKGAGKDALVLATGNTADYRQPGHFKALSEKAGEYGLKDSFRTLGLVPGADVASLMRNAVAVINPSLFEGWSTTVEEAKSAGKRMILSDIPVHREQAGDRKWGAAFFRPDDARGLSEVMWEALTRRDPAADLELMKRAAGELQGRRAAFARLYQDIVLESVHKAADGK